ncbi:MAG TPA: hypothetical protein VGM88_06255 [Kofleriaceae bacterium]
MKYAALAAVLLAAACGDDGNANHDGGPGSDADPNGYVQVAQESPNPKLDMLFVIDDTLLDEQLNLATNIPPLLETFDTIAHLTDIHFAVVTSDMGTSSVNDAPAPSVGQEGQQGACVGHGKAGAFQIGQVEPQNISGTYIDTENTADLVNTVPFTLAQMVQVGASGCGFEQPLAAMKAALDGSNGGNAGFLRDDATLAVVILTDEDDCSASHGQTLFSADTSVVGPMESFRCTRFGVTCSGGGATSDAMNMAGNKTGCTGSTDDTYVEPPSMYVDYLKSLKSDPSNILVNVIAGPTSPFGVELRAPGSGQDPIPALAHSCMYTGGDGEEVADPAVRLQDFANGFVAANTFSTICQADLSPATTLIGSLAAAKFGTGCLSQVTPDADPNTPGLQLDCIVTDTLNGVDTDVPACTVGTQPLCWDTTQAGACTDSPHLTLVVHRQVTPDPATITRMTCRA